MIIRIYRVQIKPELRGQFETEFQKVANEFVDGRDGLISFHIGRPLEFAPNTYVMVTHWENVESVKRFAGPNWGDPIIPEHMKKFTECCWLDQFESF